MHLSSIGNSNREGTEEQEEVERDDGEEDENGQEDDYEDDLDGEGLGLISLMPMMKGWRWTPHPNPISKRQKVVYEQMSEIEKEISIDMDVVRFKV